MLPPGSFDSKFGSGTENAVKKYQGKKGLTQDGIVGDGTWNALVSDIKTIQQLLKNKGYYASTVDGLAGSGTYNAVISFQKASGLTADGMVGSATLNALTLLRAVQVVNLIQSLCLLIETIFGHRRIRRLLSLLEIAVARLLLC